MLTDRSRTAIAIARFGRTRLSRASLACSGLAIAIALTSTSAHAQAAGSFQGSATTTFGNATVTTGTNTTTVTVNSPSAVIDWTPFDTATSPLAITWQPNGTTATYTGAANYAVLNRIVPTDPTRAIAFDGMVNSLVNGTPGGTVFFYSPGGIILSPNARFNVGNLGLTSSAPVVDAAGNWYTGNQVQFQASDAGRMVNTLAGSQITAPAEGSYVALVAPSINHAGSINVNGQAALVSADAATITFAPSGLFDIQVTSGTSANVGGVNNTLASNGTITGPASSGAGDNHRIYLVTVPKNDAISLAIGSGANLGFDVAGSADLVGNVVVLSAGQNIVGGNIATFSNGAGSGQANISVEGATVTSNLQMRANNNAFFFSVGGSTASAASNVSIIANAETKLSSDGTGSSTTVAGNLTLQRGNLIAPHVAEIFASNNGNVTINGTAMLSTIGIGQTGTGPTVPGGTGTGGIGIIQAQSGGDVTINGVTTIQAIGIGGTGVANGSGGSGVGGRGQIFARDTGSTVTINNAVNVQAGGIGGNGNGTGAGGSGTGGVAIVNAQSAAGGAVNISGPTTIFSRGTGGTGGVGGNGTGGTATAAASAGNTLSFGSTLSVDAQGVGGAGTVTGGVGTGGAARLTLFQNGTINVASNATVIASGNSGSGGTRTGQSGIGGVASAVAQQNSALDVNGGLNVIASGVGLTIVGSGADGGSAAVGATGNSLIDVAGVVRVRADGVAGDTPSTTGQGGNGSGGNAQLFANTGGDVIANELNVAADGIGGVDTGSGAGSGTGGSASIFTGDPGSTITINVGNSTGTLGLGDFDFLSAEGFGGASNGGGSGLGGSAVGGTANITVNNGAVLNGPTTGGSQGLIRILSRATGGAANTGATAGGNAAAGTINITIDNGTYTSAQILPSAFAAGGSASATATGVINGGNAVGGTRNISVLNGGSLSTSSPGGTAGGAGGNGSAQGRGGDASGGVANLTVDNNATFNLDGNFAIFTTNSGGFGLSGGNASGGTAFARIANGSTVNQTAPTANFTISADVVGNSAIVAGTGTGGILTAGTATLTVDNATVNVQNLNVSATATAGPQFYAQASNATGGAAVLELTNSGRVNAQTVVVAANGSGGSLATGQSGVAGNGIGGDARLRSFAGANILNSATGVSVTAGGVGGSVDGGIDSTTGSGIGGLARIIANAPGSMIVTTPAVSLEADGEGGEVLSGSAAFAGDGTGGTAEAVANLGSLTIDGNLIVEVDNDSGEGFFGGDGLRRMDGTPNIQLRAQGGALTVTGVTQLQSIGEGDSGGSATGGFIVVDAQSNAGGSGTITLNGLRAVANAFGGDGPATNNPNATGGDGGDAFGGSIQVFGSAGNGNLVINGDTMLEATAIGGTGGTGAAGATGTAGGIGGDAQGGFIQFGTRSGLDTGTVNTGSATFDTVNALANAFAGNGGAGGSGTTQGAGGAGGNAFGGGISLLVRGSPVTFNDSVTMAASQFGGDGGAGSVQGIGGNATGTGGDAPGIGNIAGIGIVGSARFNQPTQGGTLTADTLFGRVLNIAGAGSTAGTATIGDSPVSLELDSTSGTVTSIDLLANGGPSATATPSLINLTNGQLNVAESLSLVTSGALTVALDRYVVNVPTLTLQASNFILPANRPVSAGTFNVTSGLGLFSDLDLVTYANFNVPFDTSFNLAGDFQVGDFTGGFDLFVTAEGSITTGNVEAEDVRLFAAENVATGAISATEAIDLGALGTITTGALVAGDQVTASAVGAVNIASASAGLVNPSTNPEAEFVVALRSLTSITTGDLSSKGSIGVGSAGSVTVGNVVTGNAGLGFLALAGTGLTTGSIDTSASVNGGRVYLANFSMESLGGEIADDFDPAPLLATTPVAIAGPIVIGGPVTTGIFQAATTQNFTSAAITAQTIQILAGQGITTGALTGNQAINLTAGASLTFGDIVTGGALFIDSGGSLTTGNVQAGEIGFEAVQGITTGSLAATSDVVLAAGSAIQTGSIASTSGFVELESTGALASGAITAGRSVSVQSGGTLSVGNVVAGPDPEGEFSIGLLGTGNVTAGNLTGVESIGLLSRNGAITAQMVGTGGSLLALASGAVNLGGVTTAATGTTYIANASMLGLGGPIDNFNPAPIFAATPVALNGAITLSGPVSGGTLTAASTGNFTAGSLNLGQRLTIGRAATAQVNGSWTAPTISIASQRLQFGGEGNSAGIGGAQTTNINLRALASQQTAILGGTTRGEGYTLTQADFGRIRTSNLSLVVDQQGVSSTARDLEIRDLTLNGSGATGGLSSVTIASPGSIRVVGDLLLQQAGANDALNVSGGQRLELVLPDASIAITGTGGALTGTLTASSNNLVAGTLDLLMQVMADPTAAGLAERLATPASTTANLDGYLRAGGIKLLSNANILLQNSGTARDFAGVTTGGGGLIIGRITPATGSGSGGTTGGNTGGTTSTRGFSFTGMLVGPNDVLMFQFTVDANSSITLRTYSYAGGTNAAGQVIPAGGFDPILALFDAAGALIGQNDDGGANVPADPTTGSRFDTFFQPSAPLAAGTYTVTVSAFPNFANGPNLSNGFTNNNSGFGNRTPNFAFDVLGATVATGPGTQTPTGPSGPLNVIGFGRSQNATGAITGEAFFKGINFGRSGDNPLVYTDLSQINACLVNTGVCAGPVIPPNLTPAPPASEITVVTANSLSDAPVPDVVEEAADSATESADEEASQSAEDEEEAEAEASAPIAPPTPLINTRPLNPAVRVVEPVAGAGNPALIGSAVNEATAQGDTP